MNIYVQGAGVRSARYSRLPRPIALVAHSVRCGAYIAVFHQERIAISICQGGE